MVGGYETVAFCEIEPYCQAVLRKHWPGVPIYDDVRKLRAHDVGNVDVITGGFPCQDISFAGFGAGIEGERSGLWTEQCRLIGELRPRFVVVENVAALVVRGLATVLGDLARIGFSARWAPISACSVGATHMRRRLFIVAYPDSFDGWQGLWDSIARQIGALQAGDGFARARARAKARVANPSELYGGADALSGGMDRNRGLGNSILPQVAAIFLQAIREAAMNESRVAA